MGDLEHQLRNALPGRQAFPHTAEQTATEAARCVLLWRCLRGQASGLSQTYSEVTGKCRSPTLLSLATLDTLPLSPQKSQAVEAEPAMAEGLGE